jgi:hypothetical protein
MNHAGIEFARYFRDMKQMQNILFATISYSIYLMLALFQSPPALPDLGGWKDVGLGTAFICAFFWMFRYFTTHIKEIEKAHREALEKKDARNEALTKEVIELSKNLIGTQTVSNETNRQVLKTLESLDAKI